MKWVVMLLLIVLVICTSCKSNKDAYIQQCVEIEKSTMFCNYKYMVEIERKNENLCKDEKYKVNCYKAIAKIKNSTKICDKLVANSRFDCLKEMAFYFNSTDYCDGIPSVYTLGSLEYHYSQNFRAECYVDYAINIDNMDYCEIVDVGDSIFNCYDKFARLKEDSLICEKIKTTATYSKGWCYSNMAQFLNDVRLCEKAEKTKPFCYYYFATKTNKAELCEKIDETSDFRKLCFDKVK